MNPQEYSFSRAELEQNLSLSKVFSITVDGYTDIDNYYNTRWAVTFDTLAFKEVDGTSLKGYISVSETAEGTNRKPVISIKFVEVGNPEGPLGGLENLTKEVRNITKPNDGTKDLLVGDETFHNTVIAKKGDIVEYKVTINNSSNASLPITIKDPIQTGLTIGTMGNNVTNDGTNIIIKDTLTATPDPKPEEVKTYTYQATVDEITAGSLITNKATTNKLKIYEGTLSGADRIAIRRAADGAELTLSNGEKVVVYNQTAWTAGEELKASANIKGADGKLTITKEFKNEYNSTRNRRAATEPIEFSFQVTGPYGYSETFNLVAGEEKIVSELYYGEYTITEIEAHGYTPSYKVGTDAETTEPAKAILNDNGNEKNVTVINKNTGGDNILNIVVTKKWVGGPKPDTVIELWRTGQEVDGTPIDQKVGVFTANATVTSETFKELAKHDPSGREFEYYVEELAIENYAIEITGDQSTGFVVTNTYTAPKTDFTATKIWVGDEKVTRPKMNFELYRKVENGEGEKVASAETKTVDGVTTTATWKDVNELDNDGNKYIYYVKESFVEDKASNANWILGEYDFINNSITNAVGAKEGSLEVEKLLKNEIETSRSKRAANEPIVFTIVVTDEYGIETSVDLIAGETKIIEKLYFGDYTIKEIETHGYIPTYTPEKTTIVKGESAPKFTVTNSRDGENPTDPNALNIKVNKVWSGGPQPEATIELHRKGKKVDGTIIDELVGSFKTSETLEKTFEKSAKHDPSGREFEYYVTEKKVENYKEPVITGNVTDGFTVTNEYDILPGAFTGTKVADNKVVKPGQTAPVV
ncbi:MAG: Cna B-type domain-containing protein, partial [Tissierellia bacterium]|nr:Cna B-type domain-containing protein [Tissierellia bacterium]